MKKFVSLAAIPLLLLTILMLVPTASAAPPTLKRPSDLIHASIEGSPPETVDPAWCYDTASGALIFNVYDTLIALDGESLDYYAPSIGTSWTIQAITETSPEGLAWSYRYTFTIRTGVMFQGGEWGAAGKYTLIPEDVEYSFERSMVQERDGGPEWMFYEPLLNAPAGLSTFGNLSVTADVVKIGKMVDHSVESNATHVWFNLAFPGAYQPFLQILTQSWSSILSKNWVEEYVIGSQGRSDWSGEWGDYTTWINSHNPEISPLDDPTPIMCGSGPFSLETYSSADQYWSVVRFAGYWRGWPADYPKPPYPSFASGPVKPAGYLNRYTFTWSYSWETRRDMFLAGDVDSCNVPREYIDQVLGQPGIRCIYPLPQLTCTNMFFTFDIDPLTPYGKINDYGMFSEDGIPRDFFGNGEWGKNVRLAFAACIDYKTYINVVLRGEAITPATAIIPGLFGYDSKIPGYTYNLTEATRLFKLVPGLWGTGFTISLPYPTGAQAGMRGCEYVKASLEAINPKFHATITAVPWGTAYLPAMVRRQLACFTMGWLADFADPHNFAVPYYASYGTFAEWQGYNNPQMDALIDRGIKSSDPAERKQIYHDIAVLARDDTPSVPVSQPTGRHFERDWVCGWYYNPLYPDVYAYNLWKWYYVPQALLDTTATQPIANYVPCDVNYDGQVNIIDITIVAQAFGSSFGPPVHPRWNFRADIDNNRIVNIIDIAAVAKYYKKTSATWTAAA